VMLLQRARKSQATSSTTRSKGGIYGNKIDSNY
jgi:hypothetical protein